MINRPLFRPMRGIRTEPPLFRVSLDATREEGSHGYAAYTGGFAATFSEEESWSKAIGEMLERSLLAAPAGAMTRASLNDLHHQGDAALDSSSLPGFLPFQDASIPERWRSPEEALEWVEAKQLDGAPILIPAQLAFWMYKRAAPEPLIQRATTSGCAGGFTRDEAILGALLEAIQRDGFLIYWLNGIAPRVIDIGSIEGRTKTFIESLRDAGLDPVFLDTTTDLSIPSCACILRSHGAEPTIALGASAGFDIESTILHSATEALSVFEYVARHPRYVLPAEYAPFTARDIRRDERLFAWKGAEMAERFAFFLAGERHALASFLPENLPSGSAAQLSFVLDRLRALGEGYEVIVYEIKNELLDRLGYHVLRTIVPALMPLYLNEYAATLDCKRLREVPPALGFEAAEHYTPWPHPFP